MKVIFLQDVPNLAKAGEIKEVASGYGRNYLIPRGLAVPASSSAVHLAEIQRQIKARKQTLVEADLAELAAQLEGKEINIPARVGAKDRLFGSVTSADIAAELEKEGLPVDKKKIELEESIRQLGSYQVVIKLAKDLTPKISVNVIGQETD